MAATGPTRHTNDGLIALTRNEIRRLFSALTQLNPSAVPSARSCTGCSGHDGDADIRLEPTPATRRQEAQLT